MKLFVYHTPEEIPSNRLPSCAIVIDVLRASSTIATALATGAEAVQVFNDLEQLVSTSEAFPEEKRLRAGERGGRQVKGFEFGNSPLAFTAENTQGRRLFLSTTNGTRCSESVRNASKVIIAALINRQAVVNYLSSKKPGTVWLVGSGWEGSYSLEDTVCAGAIIDGVLAGGKTPLAKLAGNDEAIAAVSLYRQWQGQLRELLECGSHGQRLLRMKAQADVAYCAQLDGVDVVPIQRGLGTFVRSQPGLIEQTCQFLARLVGRKSGQKEVGSGVREESTEVVADQEVLKPEVAREDKTQPKPKKVRPKAQAQVRSPAPIQNPDKSLPETEEIVELKITPQQKSRQITSASTAKSRLKAIGEKLSVLSLPDQESTENNQDRTEEAVSTSAVISTPQIPETITGEEPTGLLEEVASQSPTE